MFRSKRAHHKSRSGRVTCKKRRVRVRELQASPCFVNAYFRKVRRNPPSMQRLSATRSGVRIFGAVQKVLPEQDTNQFGRSAVTSDNALSVDERDCPRSRSQSPLLDRNRRKSGADRRIAGPDDHLPNPDPQLSIHILQSAAWNARVGCNAQIFYIRH